MTKNGVAKRGIPASSSDTISPSSSALSTFRASRAAAIAGKRLVQSRALRVRRRVLPPSIRDWMR
jgi:hypothetical protein